jgi:hypothetical protein
LGVEMPTFFGLKKWAFCHCFTCYFVMFLLYFKLNTFKQGSNIALDRNVTWERKRETEKERERERKSVCVYVNHYWH